MVLVHYLYFCTQRFYRCSCRTSWFLEYVSTTQMIMLAKTQIIKFLAIYPVRCRVWHSENLLHRSTLQFTDSCCSQWFLCHCIATRVLVSITSSELCGQDFELAYMQLSHVYLMSALDVMHVIKCTRLSPSLAGESLGMRVSNLPWTPQTVLYKPPSMLNSLKQYDHIDL